MVVEEDRLLAAVQGETYITSARMIRTLLYSRTRDLCLPEGFDQELRVASHTLDAASKIDNLAKASQMMRGDVILADSAGVGSQTQYGHDSGV